MEGPHQGQNGFHHHLVAIADEDPQTDSFVKQLAAHVAEIANHPYVAASKHGKNGLESWTIPNRSYQDGIGALPEALEYERGGMTPPLP